MVINITEWKVEKQIKELALWLKLKKKLTDKELRRFELLVEMRGFVNAFNTLPILVGNRYDILELHWHIQSYLDKDGVVTFHRRRFGTSSDEVSDAGAVHNLIRFPHMGRVRMESEGS